MPVHKCTKDGKAGWQWGNQKCFIGEGAKAKAEKQGRAIRASQHVTNAGHNPLRSDPTRTITLRKQFTREFFMRFNRIKREITALVDERDAFGLRSRNRIFNQDPDQPRAFAFETTSTQVQEFEAWLATRIDEVILGGGVAPSEGYWADFVEQGYRKGAGRAFDDARKPFARGFAAAGDDVSDFFRGTRFEFLRSAFGQPESIDKIKLLAGRTFTDLKGVTQAMATQISRELVTGLSQGDNPRVIARRLNKAVEDIGKARAKQIAQTEIIRAHAEGQLDSIEKMGFKTVTVMVEWSTTGDDRVCFTKNTLVETDSGMVPIQSITPGMMVKTRGGFHEVVETANREYTGTMTQVTTSLGPTHCTADHPFWDVTEGWSEAGSLTDEYVLLSSDGSEVPIESVMNFAYDAPVTVYDIQVDVEPEFYANGVLVHNCPLCEALDGMVLTIKEARGLIPRHTSCRCAFLPANVGETPKARSQKEIQAALDASVAAELPKGRVIKGVGRRFQDPVTGTFIRKRNRTLAAQKKLSTWPGATKKIAKKRPKPFVVE